MHKKLYISLYHIFVFCNQVLTLTFFDRGPGERWLHTIPPAPATRQYRCSSCTTGNGRKQVSHGKQWVPLPAVLRGDDDDDDQHRRWRNRFDAPARVPAGDGPKQRQPAPRRHDAQAAQRQLRQPVLQPEVVNATQRTLKNFLYEKSAFVWRKRKKPAS